MSNPVSVGDDLVERMTYMVGNPSAWADGFDEGASEMLREAASQLVAVTAERDAAIALNNKYAWERDKAREERDVAERRSEAHWSPRLATAEDQLKAARDGLEAIRELNMTGVDENGHRWSHSDLIDQEIRGALNPKAPS